MKKIANRLFPEIIWLMKGPSHGFSTQLETPRRTTVDNCDISILHPQKSYGGGGGGVTYLRPAIGGGGCRDSSRRATSARTRLFEALQK